jgi:hypothetical protein
MYFFVPVGLLRIGMVFCFEAGPEVMFVSLVDLSGIEHLMILVNSACNVAFYKGQLPEKKLLWGPPQIESFL